MSKYQSVGPIRNLTSKYVEIQKIIIDYPKKGKNLNDSRSIINDNGKLSLIYPKNGENSESNSWYLPPKYMEIFDSTNDILKELYIKYSRLQEDQQKRIMFKFNDDENIKLDKHIKLNRADITKKLKYIEENLKKIHNEKIESVNERKIRDNMRVNLVIKIQEFVKIYKKNEDDYFNKFKELVGDDSKNAASIDSKSNMMNKDFLSIEVNNEILKKRDQDINILCKSIEELSSIFKDLQMLVIDQGTVLDRIDFNIDNAQQNTKDANIQLQLADKNTSNNCSRNTNLILMVIIFFISLLILIKLFK